MKFWPKQKPRMLPVRQLVEKIPQRRTGGKRILMQKLRMQVRCGKPQMETCLWRSEGRT